MKYTITFNPDGSFTGVPSDGMQGPEERHSDNSQTSVTTMENQIQTGAALLQPRIVRHSGNARHRLKQNPLERQYAEVWRQKQDSGLLEYLMGDGATRGVVSERDELVAATVIQWLGSPVGQGFLRDVNSLPNA